MLASCKATVAHSERLCDIDTLATIVTCYVTDNKPVIYLILPASSLYNLRIILCFCSLKTSLTKWKPDFDSAASEYAKAGELNQ